MNNALTVLLAIAILAAAGVYAIKTRYQVIQDPKMGTILIDNWDFAQPRIIERRENGSWIALDVVKGGPSVIEFESDINKKEEEEIFKPAI